MTLPAAYYVDGEYFKREMSALFGRMWLCAGRAESVERPGQFFVREVLGESVIVTRAQSGVVRQQPRAPRCEVDRRRTDREIVHPGLSRHSPAE